MGTKTLHTLQIEAVPPRTSHIQGVPDNVSTIRKSDSTRNTTIIVYEGPFLF